MPIPAVIWNCIYRNRDVASSGHGLHEGPGAGLSDCAQVVHEIIPRKGDARVVDHILVKKLGGAAMLAGSVANSQRILSMASDAVDATSCKKTLGLE